MKKAQIKHSFPVKDVIRWETRGVLVQFGGGIKRTEWLPRRYVEFWPGLVMIPDWLVKKLNLQGEGSAC